MSLFTELKRRNVFRVAIAYLAAAWLLTEVAGTLFPMFGYGEDPARIVVVLLTIGFPLFLVFSWVFEITPEGLKLEKDVKLEESITAKTGKNLDRAIIVLLALVLGYFAFDKFVLEPGRVAQIVEETAQQARTDALIESFGDKSIAVLPFENRSMRPEDEYFTDGMHNELLSRLARIAALRVISGTSVEKYRNTEKSLPEIARELSVATILEGAVQKVENQVRINAQLIDANTDEHLWAETFDRELTTTNLFFIQTEIAEKVAKSLQATLTPEEKTRVASVPTDNFAAYDALLRGNLVLKAGTVESLHQAIEYYQRAVALRPDFAQAYLAMAEAYFEAIQERGVADTEGWKNVEDYAQKALSLDESLGLAYYYLAWVKRIYGQYEEAESLFRKGVELEPGNALILHGLGLTLRLQGRAPEAVPYYDRAMDVDPLSMIINESRGSLLRDLGRFEDSENQYRNTLLLDPDFVNTYWGMGTLYWSMGQPGQAIEWFENAVRLTPYGDVFRSWLALMYLELGQNEQAQAVIDEAKRIVPSDEDNDIMLMNELLRIYRGQETSDLPDAREFTARYWYGALVDLPIRALLRSNFKQAIDKYEVAAPGISSGRVDIDGSNYRDAIYVAFALKKLGEHERADGILNRTGAFLESIQRLGIHGYWVADAQIHAIRGNNATSLALLQTAVDEGWRNLWRFYFCHDPILEPIHLEPGFRELLTRIEQEMADQWSDVENAQARQVHNSD